VGEEEGMRCVKAGDDKRIKVTFLVFSEERIPFWRSISSFGEPFFLMGQS
jgi:hypothetical protein